MTDYEALNDFATYYRQAIEFMLFCRDRCDRPKCTVSECPWGKE